MKIIKKSSGFTLIEIMIAVAIMGILVAGIYGLFTSMYNNYISQNQLTDVEQNARIGIEQMIREIRLAGYKTPTGTLATYKTTSTDFVFQENVQPVLGSGVGANKKIEYYWDQANKVLKRGQQDEVTSGTGTYLSDSTSIAQTPLFVSSTNNQQNLSIPVTNLAFTYYDANNTQLTPNATSNFTTITRMRVTLTTQGKNPSPDNIGINVGGVYYKTVTVDADIRLRNMGIGQANSATPPAPPTNLQSRDTGNPCGSLTLSWAANTESDLAGYVIYYKPSGSAVPYYVVNVGNSTSFVIQNLVIGTTYDINAKAYNTSGLYSGYSLSPTGLVAANATLGGASIQDTQPNILAPAPPTITQATAGNKLVTLTWTASTTGNVQGYNIYRSAYSGSAYGSFVLVNQNGPVTGTTFTDTFTDPSAPIAPNCPLTYLNKHSYQYNMASVDCSGSGGIGSYSTTISGPDAGTPYNTYPKDAMVPGDPTIFSAGAGSQQVFLSWNAPADPDVMGVTVLSRDNSAVSPTISSFSRTVYQDSTIISPYQSYGTVDNGQNLTGAALSPLPNYQQYSYTAFAFDKCGNFSLGVASNASAIPCGDASWPGAPGPPSQLTGQDFGGIVTLTWTAPTTNTQGNSVNGTTTNYSANPTPTTPATPVWDLSGYNVYRCPYVAANGAAQICTRTQAVDYNGVTGNPLNTSPVLNPTFNDTKVSPGQIWLYAVTAIDCKYPGNPIPNSGHESTPTADAGNPLNLYVQVSIGGLQQDIYFLKATSTGGNSTFTLNDTTAPFSTTSTQAYSTGTLRITAGTDAGERRPIVLNSTTTVTIPTNYYPWPGNPVIPPDATSAYEIDRPITANTSNPTLNPLAHDDVLFWVKNTNPAQINIRNLIDTAAISWRNYNYSSTVVGTDKTGVPVSLIAVKVNGTTLWSVNPGFGVTSGSNLTFTASTSLTGLQTGVPMELIFADGNGNPPNMKGETININMTYQLVNADGTFTNGIWQTGVGSIQPILVPYGIIFPNWYGGTPIVQWPTGLSPLPPYATTSSGSNVLSQGAGSVFIYAYMYDSVFTTPYTGGGIPISATLYYCKQTYGGSASWGSNVTSTAPGVTNSCWTPMNIPIPWPSYQGGWAYYALIPESSDPYRIWYYVKAVDNTGNLSSTPSYNINGMSAYTYDQNDTFLPSFTLTWTFSTATTPQTYSLTATGTVGDAGNAANNTAGATVTGTYTGSVTGSVPLTATLGSGTNTFTSSQVFSKTETGVVTFQITKPGFKTSSCWNTTPLNNAAGQPPALTLTCQ